MFKPIFIFTEKKKRNKGSTSNYNTNKWAIEKLSSSISENQIMLKRIFEECSDVVFREFTIGVEQKLSGVIIWIDGLADKTILNSNIMRSFVDETYLLYPNRNHTPSEAYSLIRDSLLSVADIKEQNKLGDIIDSVLSGESAILIDGVPISLIVSTQGWASRDVAEPITEGVVRGPRQGFTEDIRTGTSLIRRIIKTPQLKMESFKGYRQHFAENIR